MNLLLRSLGPAVLALAVCAGAPAHAAAAPSSAPAPDEPAGDESRRALSDADSYVRLPSVQASIRDRTRRMRGSLQVSLALDAPRGRTRSLIEERRVFLRDAYNETLLLYASRIYRWGDVPDADMIGMLLQQDTDRLLGEGQATVVLDTVMIHGG
jgi:hypothetical protein